MEVPQEETSAYGIAAGIVDPSDSRLLQISTLIEKPPAAEAPSNLAVVGRYVLGPEIFDLLTQVKPGKGDEIQLTDALAMLAATQNIVGWRFEGERFDAGDMAGYMLANLNWARKSPRVWQAVQDWWSKNGAAS
jgi:UTP--glucose-1-phosphate uridylyltransferase